MYLIVQALCVIGDGWAAALSADAGEWQPHRSGIEGRDSDTAGAEQLPLHSAEEREGTRHCHV